MPIPLVVTKRYEGQRVTSWCDNSLLRPTGIQIATKIYMRHYKQALANNVKTVHQTLLHKSRATSIDSNCYRLPTASVFSNKQSGQIKLQSVLINKIFLKQTIFFIIVLTVADPSRLWCSKNRENRRTKEKDKVW